MGQPLERFDEAVRHGGNLQQLAARLDCHPGQVLDASASLVPFGPPPSLRRALHRALGSAVFPYPDRGYLALRQAIAQHHGLDAEQVLPGNGAAELFTWAARDAAAWRSLLPVPGFLDYPRALACWDAPFTTLPLRLHWSVPGPLDPVSAVAPGLPRRWLEDPQGAAAAAGGSHGRSGGTALWITNPHNPTSQLWGRTPLQRLLQHHDLVIVDEAFLPLVPNGEAHSLIPLLPAHPNLVVIRSLTKQFAMAGLRLGYALGDPARLQRWQGWRDPWPVNGLAAAVAPALLADQRWQRRVHRWVARELSPLQQQLNALPGITALPSAANYLLLRGERSLLPLRLGLERQRIVLRDCRSFVGLDEHWLRLALCRGGENRRIVRAMGQLLGTIPATAG